MLPPCTHLPHIPPPCSHAHPLLHTHIHPSLHSHTHTPCTCAHHPHLHSYTPTHSLHSCTPTLNIHTLPAFIHTCSYTHTPPSLPAFTHTHQPYIPTPAGTSQTLFPVQAFGATCLSMRACTHATPLPHAHTGSPPCISTLHTCPPPQAPQPQPTPQMHTQSLALTLNQHPCTHPRSCTPRALPRPPCTPTPSREGARDAPCPQHPPLWAGRAGAGTLGEDPKPWGPAWDPPQGLVPQGCL